MACRGRAGCDGVIARRRGGHALSDCGDDGSREVVEPFGQLFAELIAQRRKRPGDDLMSALLAAEVDGER